MKRMAHIYLQYIKLSFASAASYRTNFFFTVLISFLSNMLLPLVTLLIYAAEAQIPGWSFHEALLIQSVFMLCTGLCAPFLSNMVWMTMSHIREGTFDTLMLKPCGTVFITIASAFDLENIGVALGGITMFVYSLANLPAPSLYNWVTFLFLFLTGILMTLGLVLIMAATTFKWVGNSRIFEIYDAVTAFGRYPGTIYGKALAVLTTYVLPIGVLGFFPASAILGRLTPQMLWACVPCVLFLLFGIYLFNKMTYLYQSAGG